MPYSFQRRDAGEGQGDVGKGTPHHLDTHLVDNHRSSKNAATRTRETTTTPTATKAWVKAGGQRLKSDLVAHNVALPPAKSRKEVYVELHLKHIDQKNAADFSSDEDEDQVQYVADEEDAGMPDPRGLTDDDLMAALLEHGVNAGPIVASTRAVYEKKLRKLLQSDGRGCPNGVEQGVLKKKGINRRNQHNQGATSATCRRPIKGAAGRPVQYMYPDTPASPTTLERREVERRLVPVQIQIMTMTDSGTKFKIFKCLKIIISSLLIAALLLFTIASVRTLSLDVNVGLKLARWEKTSNISLVIDDPQREQLLARFKEAIRIPTVSFSGEESNTTALLEFDSFLRKAFPTVFSSSLVRHELVANYSHLFWVPGLQSDLVPYLLLAHIDVVPASESDGWEAPPFSAKEIDGFIYGRGTIDDKGALMVGGYKGAMNIVRLLKQRGVQLSFVLDEGLAVLDGVISGLEGPAALLEENPMPRLFGQGPERGTFEHLAHKFGLPMKFIMSNLWLFAPLLGRVLERKPDTNAFVRTTTAVTMFNAGVKVLELIRSTVGDQRVKLELVDGFDPLPVSSMDEAAFGYQIIKKTVLDMFPTVTVAPGICIGNTDSRHFKDLTNDIYRFAPIWFKPGDAQRFHGINERISKKNYEELVVFYFSLIQNCDIQKLPTPHGSIHEL
ncbi:putative carboxypeptidase PM20D1.2 [Liparis tanakae]|uniref:Putative carboxypeptidase PM20D1.2 n=1 Tax=Liparis tanakae TaxID=230148 RepID=A0A4Z2GTY0_9TELE|nr:putative carboxypeptidase PM20D1.2 [Liparis tanakae]